MEGVSSQDKVLAVFLVPKDLLPALHLLPSVLICFQAAITLQGHLLCPAGRGRRGSPGNQRSGRNPENAARSSQGVSLKFSKRGNNPATLPLGSNPIHVPPELPYSRCESSFLSCPQFTQARSFPPKDGLSGLIAHLRGTPLRWCPHRGH